MKQINEKNVRAILGKDYPCLPDDMAAIRLGAWLNSYQVVKGGLPGDWKLLADSDRGSVSGIFKNGKRPGLTAMKRALEAAFVRPLHLVKEDLDKWWSAQVAGRDGRRCVLCGKADACSAHHWYVNKSRSRMARWDVINGVWLCYGCHIHVTHDRPDYRTYRRLYEHARVKFFEASGLTPSPGFHTSFLRRIESVNTLAETEASDSAIRKLWLQHLKTDETK